MKTLLNSCPSGAKTHFIFGDGQTPKRPRRNEVKNEKGRINRFRLNRGTSQRRI